MLLSVVSFLIMVSGGSCGKGAPVSNSYVANVYCSEPWLLGQAYVYGMDESWSRDRRCDSAGTEKGIDQHHQQKIIIYHCGGDHAGFFDSGQYPQPYFLVKSGCGLDTGKTHMCRFPRTGHYNEDQMSLVHDHSYSGLSLNVDPWNLDDCAEASFPSNYENYSQPSSMWGWISGTTLSTSFSTNVDFLPH